MYFRQRNEIPFWLGDFRAFVNPPLPAKFQVGPDQFVYRADQAIRINREALLNHYDIVLRDVARMARLPRTAVHVELQNVLCSVWA